MLNPQPCEVNPVQGCQFMSKSTLQQNPCPHLQDKAYNKNPGERICQVGLKKQENAERNIIPI
jgi:hypothetical protein